MKSFSNAVLLLVLCITFLSTVECAKFTVGLKRHQKPKRHIVRDDSNSTTPKTYGELMASQHNLEYQGLVTVGTPPQIFQVIFDTGSDVFWLPKKGCTSTGDDTDACASGKGLYDPSASKTSKDTKQPFQIEYGTGSATGEYYQDVLSFGDASNSSIVSIGNVTLGAAQHMTFSDQGILGLSFPVQNDFTPVFITAAKRKVFDKPIFTVFLKKCKDDCDDGGLITFGGFDNQNCKKIIGATSLIGGVPYWMFKVNSIGTKGAVVKNQKAIVDTGTSIIIGPQSAVGKILKKIGAKDIGGGNYIANCNAKFSLNLNINGKKYSVSSTQMLLDQGQGICQVALGYDPEINFWILGDPFLRQYCTVHNVVKKIVQFAPTKNGSGKRTGKKGRRG
ncbi:unnamed protein product [Bursaphelenchus okinawaensis]|uniref:Peptidase A1 domain-containing protein n=1 Tax=Bursaphelenchus okinawaensis TaxID=465554 RepID=A0A811L0X9_9BILA|nr:unnamed protein product [Bursaphelenchus okinawaensis]CAG9114142.1 unnamed protein product [Bursaphelenchus okinawaensis]